MRTAHSCERCTHFASGLERYGARPRCELAKTRRSSTASTQCCGVFGLLGVEASGVAGTALPCLLLGHQRHHPADSTLHRCLLQWPPRAPWGTLKQSQACLRREVQGVLLAQHIVCPLLCNHSLHLSMQVQLRRMGEDWQRLSLLFPTRQRLQWGVCCNRASRDSSFTSHVCHTSREPPCVLFSSRWARRYASCAIKW